MKNIIYIRVSKEDEKEQKPEDQQKAILEKYKLKEYHALKPERCSAYDIDKIEKRTQFILLLRYLFNSDTTTIEDLFLNRVLKPEINLYVWDYHRIMRHFEFNLLFGLLSDLCEINIYSYKQGRINREKEETPLEKFSRYIFYSINAFSSEDYSYNISTNVKKTVEKQDGITISSKGNKWGNKFTGTLNNPRNNEKGKVELTTEEINTINKRIKQLKAYYRKHRVKYHLNAIILKIEKEYGIVLSKPYISTLK